MLEYRVVICCLKYCWLRVGCKEPDFVPPTGVNGRAVLIDDKMTETESYCHRSPMLLFTPDG